ncbi:MAG: protein kinase [Bryobacteraceae bacterium]
MRSGDTINAYEILAPIGAGGMGEVYRARDTRLNREVAIKVLPANMAADNDSLHRFQREAQMLASLSHPNIAAIHGLEIDGVTRAIVMELVEGPTLADRIAAGPIPVDEALPIARQIAEALEAAHDKGIIHRDLKPANVKVTPDGMVKVLDFGLAKALEEDRAVAQGDPASSPTLVAGRSSPGLILGTAGYMSPEQARGGVVDKRTDIWAFGVVLYEILTGKRLFDGETISDTLAAVLKTDPDWSALPGDTPEHVRHMLQRALERDRKKRLRDIGVFLETPPTASLPQQAAVPVQRERWVWKAVAAVLALFLVAALLRKPAAQSPPLRHTLIPAKDLAATPRSRSVVISPDGKHIVMVAAGKLWVRSLDRTEMRPLDFTEGAEGPIWSPDSNSIAFAVGSRLCKVQLQGGRAVTLANVRQFRGGSWAPSGKTILYADTSGGIMEVDASGGTPRVLFPRPSDVMALYSPEWLVEGKALVAGSGSLTAQQIVLIRVGEKKMEVLREGAFATLSRSGHLLYQTAMREAGLWALPVGSNHEPTGAEPIAVTKNGSYPSLSREGTLLFTEVVVDPQLQLVYRDRTGKEIARDPHPAPGLTSPRFSPDGSRITFSMSTDGSTNIWVQEVATGVRSRVTFTQNAFDIRPLWYPNGKELLYRSGTVNLGIQSISLDGNSQPKAAIEGNRPGDWSSDGRFFLYTVQTADTAHDISAIERKPDGSYGKPFVLVRTPAEEDQPRFAPGNRFFAYLSEESGRAEVYVRSFPDPSRKWQVSTSGGGNPIWSSDGKELLYVEGNRLVHVAVNITGAEFTHGRPELLWSNQTLEKSRPINAYNFDMTPDGKKFVVAEELTASRPDLHLIQSWTELLNGPAKP